MPGWVAKFYALPQQERSLLLEGGCLTGVARLAILAPFKRLAPLLGEAGAESPREVDGAALEIARKIGKVIGMLSRRTPWQTRCLAQAVAGQLMLRRRGISGTVYLGVAKNSSGELTAHAWLRCGQLIVTGAPGLEKYTVVVQFGRQ